MSTGADPDSKLADESVNIVQTESLNWIEEQIEGAKNSSGVKKSTGAPGGPLAAKKLSTFAWDQSDKFVKIYLTLSGVESANSEQVKFDVTETSIDLRLSSFNQCNYEFIIKGFFDPIVPEKSYYKLKKDTILLMLKKSREQNNWSHLTALEKKEEDARTARYKKKEGDADDPNAGLMGMMKQMYDEGDDETKRMIRKTWHENQNKKSAQENLLGAFQ